MTTDSAARAVAWLPYEPKSFDGLPDEHTYHYLDGEDLHPSDTAEARFPGLPDFQHAQTSGQWAPRSTHDPRRQTHLR